LLGNASVRRAFQQVQHFTDRVDVIINNAGVMGVKDFVLSEDGVESQFAACYLSHFLLTNLLVKAGIIGREGDRVVNVGSLGYQLAEVDLDDINFQIKFPTELGDWILTRHE
jgi:NAD(P)-dependent dehydrogenase (short-subunit alcohol dehydrogenase family)